ncbi:MAG: four helix bundle protein [Acidobacteriia bacterium]|nr:four helix bundle protein [Terriglobia bacterium]
MKDFRDLKVWERSHQLTLDVYKATAGFPREELFGLTSQMRRCSASIGANIAEGCGKRGNNEFQRFLQIASGSASELDYHLLLARDLHFLPDADYRRIASELSQLRKMLTSLLQKVDHERALAKC